MTYCRTVRMHRAAPPAGRDWEAHGNPAMTALEAADEMERSHGTRLWVHDTRNEIVGLLREEDIIQKVLAQGRRPDTVRVSDIMVAGHMQSSGVLMLEDDQPAAPAIEDHDGDRLSVLVPGRCEECGVYHDDLTEVAGLLLCGPCTGAAPDRD